MKEERNKKKIEKAPKIFYDILFDYQDLKYIFEYGFSWDDKKDDKKDSSDSFVPSKNSQKRRKLSNILKKDVWENCVSLLWRQSIGEDKSRKSGRKLIWKNNYQLTGNNWFEDLYGCYGLYESYEANKMIQNCSMREHSYSKCRPRADFLEDNTASNSRNKGKNANLNYEDVIMRCTFSTVCRIEEEKSVLQRLASKAIEKSEYDDKIEFLQRYIISPYQDVIEFKNGRVTLSENSWTFQIMKQDEIFCSEQRYEKFLDMIRFFTGFAPMSVLGSQFLTHLKERTFLPFLFVRNLPPFFGLEQEYIYRCLYAMVNGRTVEYEDKEYIPVKLFYRDKNYLGIEEHLYLEVREKDGRLARQETLCLPLRDGLYIMQGKTLSKKRNSLNQMQNSKQKTIISLETKYEYIVAFYHNALTQYILKRTEDYWADYIIHIQDDSKKYIMDSPYYPNCTQWKIRHITYQILERDIPGFRLFLQSFGDFAKIEKEPDIPENPYCGSEKTENKEERIKKGRIKECQSQSLLNAYTSKEVNLGAKRKIPARRAELEWLYFILLNYPNMCQIFLDKEELLQIRDKIDQEKKPYAEKTEAWFVKERIDFGNRIVDIRPDSVKKYRWIFSAVQEQKLLEAANGSISEPLFPYALEYDVMRSIALNDKQPIQVMCYSLTEKRNKIIEYKTIRAKNAIDKNDYEFTELDKIYHIMAYLIRCTEGKKKKSGESSNVLPKWSKADQFLSFIWKKDSRTTSYYNRLIRKRFQGKESQDKEFLKWNYDQFYDLVREYPDYGGEVFLERAFGYYNEKVIEIQKDGELTGFYWKYQFFLLNCVMDACKCLWKKQRLGMKMKRFLADVDTTEIWDLINGEYEEGSARGEIVFYNEKLKNTYVTFLLKKNREDKIDLVYELFQSFLCAGEVLTDNRIQFTVTYEEFHYRKIHMILMAIVDFIEELKPDDTAYTIQKRKENKEKNAG